MTTLKLTLAIKNEAHNMSGHARLTFYKNPDAAMNPMGVEIADAGALDMAVLSAEAANYKVGSTYVVTVTEQVGEVQVHPGSPRLAAVLPISTMSACQPRPGSEDEPMPLP